MTKRRAKVSAAVTVAGLAALGGVALESNHGLPVATPQAAGSGAGSTAVVTSASGAVLNAQPGTVREGATTRPPIVTRASGGGGRAELDG